MGIDLGTANTLFIYPVKALFSKSLLIAIDQNDKVPLAGDEAKKMMGRTPRNVVVRPLRNSVIADFDTAELMLKPLSGVYTKAATLSPGL